NSLAPHVLDTYEQERKPHARSMIRLALGIGRCMTSGGELGNARRRSALPSSPPEVMQRPIPSASRIMERA
ncbi:hypothetical protein C6A85_11165, partial [Mycobacterium sp. ITM-2017-0098]